MLFQLMKYSYLFERWIISKIYSPVVTIQNNNWWIRNAVICNPSTVIGDYSEVKNNKIYILHFRSFAAENSGVYPRVS